jgi:RNA polymerase sigma-70 factor, ECF subfamily
MSTGPREEEDAFDRFFAAESDRLVGQAYLLVGDLNSAQDLAQRALERVWRHWAEVRHYERPDAWARRVLFNLVLNEQRRQGREIASAIFNGPVIDGPSERHVALVQALRQLPPDQRKAIVLHDGAGLRVHEVAAELQVPEGTVRSWLSRGRGKLAEALSDEPRSERECRTEAG